MLAVVAVVLLALFPVAGLCGRGSVGLLAPPCRDGRGVTPCARMLPPQLIPTVALLSKPPCQSRRLADYANEVLAPGCLQQAAGWELAVFARGFSRLMGSDYQNQGRAVLVAIAGIVTSENGRAVRGWDIYNLSMMAGAFGTALEQGGRALNLIADEISRRWDESHTGDNWSMHSLVTLGSAFSKLKGKSARRALKAIAGQVVVHKALLRDKGQCSVHTLVILANALCKADGERVQAALREIADVIVHREFQLIDAERWLAADLAMMANALSKADGKRISAALKAIARALISRRRAFSDSRLWPVKHLSIVANGISKIAGDDDVSEVMGVLARVVADQGQLADEKLWSAQDLAMFGNGISKEKSDSIQRVLIAMARAMRSRPDLQDRRKWSAQSLAMVANAISKEEGDGDVNRALGRIAKVVVQRGAELQDRSQWTRLSLVMMANAISKIDTTDKDDVNAVMNFLAEEVMRRQRVQEGAVCWPGQSLSVLAGAFRRAGGGSVLRALRWIAREIAVRRSELSNHREWTPKHLATVSCAISTLPVDDITTEALYTIADAVVRQAGRLKDAQIWNACDLSLITNALSKVEGTSITQVQIQMAKALVYRKTELQDRKIWLNQYLALMANAIAKIQENSIIEALRIIAEVMIQRQAELNSQDQWPLKHLAMISNGVSRVSGDTASGLLAQIAAAVERRGQALRSDPSWSPDSLIKLASGMHLWSCVRAFEFAVDSLLSFAENPSAKLAWLLARMGSWCLQDAHLRAAGRLFQTLRNENHSSNDLGVLEHLMWSATVMHFTCEQRRHANSDLDPAGPGEAGPGGEPLSELAPLFAESYQRYKRQWLDIIAATDVQQKRRKKGSFDHWHLLFAKDYWQQQVAAPTISQARRLDTVITDLQRRIFEALSAIFTNDQIKMEARVNQFSVDILLGRRVCIEIDGPCHFVPCPATPSGCRRSKDALIDHILQSYGLDVVRIPYTVTVDSEEFKTLVQHIRLLLNRPGTLSL